jgi:tetratricopeptide (TPR) repeat protein
MPAEMTAEAIDELWDYGDPAESETRFRGLLRDLGPGSQAYAEVLTQAARAQGLQRQFEAAHATLDRAETLLAHGPNRARARYLLERGRVFNSSRQRDKAAALFREALAAASAAGEDFYAVDAAHMLGIAEGGAAKVAWHLRAMNLAEQSTQPRARQWLASLYNNLGWTLHDQGEYERALGLFEKALEYRQARGQNAEALIAQWCVARCLRSLGRVEEALERQRALLAAHASAGSRDGFVFEEMGESLLALGQAQEARPYFAQAHAELSQDDWLVENEPARVERLRDLSLSN